MSKRKTWLNLNAKNTNKVVNPLKNLPRNTIQAASARFTNTNEALSLSNSPYLTILENAKASELPRTFEECVDFFFPTSGVMNYDRSDSSAAPFVSTLVSDYHQVTNSTTSNSSLNASVFDGTSINLIPKHLGDVSLMLGYFLLYRTLLAPNTFAHIAIPQAEDQVFNTKSEEAPRVVNRGAVKRSAYHTRKLIKMFNRTKQILGASLDVAQGAVSGKIDIENMTPQDAIALIQDNPELSAVLNEGISEIVSQASSALGIHPKYIGLIAKHGLNMLTSEEWRELSIKDIAAKDAILTFAFHELVDLGIPREEALQIREAFVTGEINPQLYNRLSSKAKTEFDKKKAELEKNLRTKISMFQGDAASSVKRKLGIRSNPHERNLRKNALATLAIIGVLTAAAAATDAYLDSRIQDVTKDLRRAENYYQSNTLYLKEDIGSDLGIKLKLDTYSNRGLPKGDVLTRFRELNIYGKERWPNLQTNKQTLGWHNRYQIPATCALVNGQLVANFWKVMWMNFKNPIAYMRDGRNLRYALEHSRPKASHKFPCPMFTPFEESAYSSLLLMLAELPKISPFSFEFGFKPSLFEENGKTMLFGHATLAKKYGHLEPSDTRKGKKFKVTTLPNSPYVYHLYQDGHTHRAVSTSRIGAQGQDANAMTFADVNKNWASQKPNAPFQIPSRRVLLGQIPQLDLHFDVGLNGFTPVFDAQWAALLSVLILYPEARNSVANSGYSYPWASRFKSVLDNHQVMASALKTAKTMQSIKSSPSVLVSSLNIPFTPTPSRSKTPASRNLAKSPLTQMLRPSASRNLVKSPLNRSLSPSILQLDLTKIPKSTPPKSTTTAAAEDTKSTAEDTKSTAEDTKSTNTPLIIGGVVATALAALGTYMYIKNKD